MSNPFDQFDASPDAGNPFDRFDAAKPTKKPGILADVGDAFVGGAKAAGQAIAATGNVYTGDEKALVEKAATQKKDQESKPEALKRFNEAVQTRAAPLGDDPGLWDSIKAVGGAVVEQPKGAGLAIIEQLPNAAPAMAGGLAGMKAGSMAGTAVAPGAGTAVGGILGGVAGMFLGNTAIETGHKAIEAAQDGSVTPQEMANVRKEGAVKAGVITGVDALTLGASKAITNAGARAVESATRKTLTDAGVNVADKAAVLAARQSPEISSAVRAAQDTALASANTLGKRAAAGGAALGLETVGEGVGEYFGELAATGKANMVDAVLESVLSLGQSGAEVAWGIARNKKSEGVGLWDIAGGKYAETKSSEIAGLLPAPTYAGTPGDQIIANDAERQAAIDAADKNAAELYAAREEFEQKLRQRVTITNEPAPLQQRIDDMLNVDTSKLTGIERTNYEKALAAAFNEPIGIRHDKDQREVPFTIGEYLDAQVALEDAVRNREKSGRAVAESGARLQQLAEEESTQQPDIPAPIRGIMPAIPVVGPLSKVANIAVQSGAAQVQQQAGAGILAPTVGGSRPVPAAEASAGPIAATATQPETPQASAKVPQKFRKSSEPANSKASRAQAPVAQTASAPSQGEASQQPATPRKVEESVQERSEREFAENYDSVQQDIPGASTKDLYRAVMFADRAIQKLNLKAQRGEPYNEAMRDSLSRERDYLQGEWQKREDRFDQPATPLPESGAPGAAITQQAQPVVPAATEQTKPETADSESKNAQQDKNSASTVAQSAENSADEAYRPLIESLIKNKRNAKQLGFDIDGAVQKAKDAMHGKKQMPGAFRNLANRAEKLGDKETASILRQIADMNDARKSPKKADPVADQNPIKSEAPAVTESVSEKAPVDQQAAEEKQSATNPDGKEGADLSWAEVLDEAWNNGFETGNADFVPQKQHLEQAYQRTFTDAQVEEYTATYQRGARESDEKADQFRNAAKKTEQGKADGYEPPQSVDDARARWSPENKKNRSAAQQSLMDAVGRALDSGLSYNWEVDEFVAKELGVTDEQRKAGTSADPLVKTMSDRVEGGAFGYDVYLARKAVESERDHANNVRIGKRLKLSVGENIGKLKFPDGKIASAATVENLSDTGATVIAARGPQKIRTTVSYAGLEIYAERAGNEYLKNKTGNPAQDKPAASPVAKQKADPKSAQDKAGESSSKWSEGTNGFTGHKSYTFQPETGAHWATVQTSEQPNSYTISYRKGDQIIETEELGGAIGGMKFHVASRVRDFAAAEKAQHIENGKTETATPSVIAASVQKSADKTAFNPKEALAWLLGKIDEAIAKAPTAEEKGVWDRVNQNVKLDGVMNLEEAIGFKVFDVPGDGRFKVLNLKERLQAFRANAEKNAGFKKPHTPRAQPVPDWQRAGRSGTEGTIRELLEDGDLTAAYEFAKQIDKPLVFGDGRDSVIAYTDARPFEQEGFDDLKMVSVRSFGRGKDFWAVIDLGSGRSIVSNEKTRAKVESESRKRLGALSADQIGNLIAAAKGGKSQEELAASWLDAAKGIEAQTQASAEQENRTARLTHSGLFNNPNWKRGEESAKPVAQKPEAPKAEAKEPAVDKTNESPEKIAESLDADKIKAGYAHRSLGGLSGKVEMERKWFADALNKTREHLTPFARNDQQKAELEYSLAKFADDYKERRYGVLEVGSSVVSSAVAGRNNFNSTQAGRRGNALDRAEADFNAWLEARQEAIKAELLRLRTNEERQADADSAEEKRVKKAVSSIVSDLATAGAIDQGKMPGMERASFLAGAVRKIENLHKAGDTESLRRVFAQIRQYNDTNKKPLFSERHSVWKFEPKAGNTEAADEVQQAATSVDYKGFERVPRGNGAFDLRDGNLTVRVEPTERGKYQASFGGAKSSPHLDGEQGAVDWADAYRDDGKRSAEPAKQERHFRNVDALNPLTAPVEDGDWFRIGGQEWQARNGYTGRGWSLIDADKKTHPTINNIEANADLIREIVAADGAVEAAAEKELRTFSEGSTDGMKSPLAVTYILRDKSDSFFEKLRGFDSPQAKFDYLQKAKGDLQIPMEIGKSKRFGDQVDLNRALRDGKQFAHFSLAPRRGYVLATLTIDLNGDAAEATATRELNVGDAARLMNIDVVLAKKETADGVRYELFNAAAMKDGRAVLRRTDIDSGNVIGIRTYNDYDQAEKEVADAVRVADQAQEAQKREAWHTDLPAEGLPLVKDQGRLGGYERVPNVVAADAWDAITQVQRTNLLPLYAYYLPAANGRNGIARLFPDDQVPPAPWKLLNGEVVRQGGVTREHGISKLAMWLRSAPILASEEAAKPDSTERSAPTPPKTSYSGPADVSSRAGQMELANRAGTIAALKAMNGQLRELAPGKSLSDNEIENAGDLDVLRDQLSSALVEAGRKKKTRGAPKTETVGDMAQSFAKAGYTRGVLPMNRTEMRIGLNLDSPELDQRFEVVINRKGGEWRVSEVEVPELRSEGMVEAMQQFRADLAALNDGRWPEAKDDVDKAAEPATADSIGWDAMPIEQREAIAVRAGWSAGKDSHITAMGRRIAARAWAEHPDHTRGTLIRFAEVETQKEEASPAESKPASLIDQHAAAMDKLRSGEASLAEYKAAFSRLSNSEEEIKAELATKTKEAILRLGGRQFAYNYKSDKKDRIIDGLYRDMLSDFAIGRGISYVLGAKDGMRSSLVKMVEGTTEETLKDYADKVAGQIAEYEKNREETKKAIADPQTVEDFRLYLRAKVSEGMTAKDARLALTPEQRIRFDTLEAEASRKARADRKASAATDVRVAAKTTEGQIVETKHTKTGEPLFVVKAAERVEHDVYNQWNANAKRLGGWYSSFRGNGAVPGFQFKTRENADAFLQYLGGNTEAAKEAIAERRDSFADDRSQSAVERLNEMADRLEERADESLSYERKTNTARRARFAASAEAAASADKAMAQTMRNIAAAIESGAAKFLDRVRQKVQVEMLQSTLASAKYDELRQKHPSYYEQEKRRGEPATAETADYANWPAFTAYRSDLARLGRELSQIDGAKKLGQQLLKVADDITEAYQKFAKENLHKVSTFKTQDGKPAVFPTADRAEAAIARSGFKGKATTISFKRGEHLVIMGPEMAREAGLWQGDDDKRITLDAESGEALVAKHKELRGKTSLPPSFVSASESRARWKGIGIETAAEMRSALREFIGLRETAKAPDKIKELERAMIGRKNTDGLDFFPTPAETAQAMIEAAEITEGMTVLEPSAGMGHIAEQIREAGIDPDVVEFDFARRELLEAKGFNVVGRDFTELSPRGFTYGDVFRAKDGRLGVMRGSGGMGSGRVGFQPLDASGEPDARNATFENREELEGIEKRGTESGYDRILMNPPFSNRRDAEHVQHAYSLLKPGGRIVAIMGEGVFFGQDKKAQAFREWLDEVGGTSEKLAEGTFMDPSLPVNTATNARMVVIDKPEGAIAPTEQNEGLGNIAARTDKVSPADTAIYGMAAEGKSSSEILKFIASASRSPFNRQLAKLLLKTGIAPKITVGDGKGWKMNAGEGHKYAAAYNPQTDTVALFRPGSAERNMLHELMHAATIKALGKNGLAAGQMKALFAHVQKVGKAYGLHYDKNTKRGTYGMADIDEFVAEAFTNPKFQEALKKVTAPKANGRISSAWQWFVRIVRGILGLPTNDESALSAALDIGLGVMREDMAIRKAGALPRSIMVDGAWRPTSNANGTQIHYTAEGVRNFWRWMDATDRQRLAGQAGQGDNQRGFHQPAERNPVVAKYFFDGRGHPRVFFHGTADSVSNFDFDHQNRLDHGWLGRGVYLSGDPELANSYANIKRGSAGPNVMPLYVALHNPLEATLEVKNAFRKRDKAWVDAWTKRAMAAGHDGVVLDLGNDFLEVVAFNPSAVKSATGNNGQFDPANLDIRYNVAEYFRSMGIKAGASDSEIEAIRADVQFVAGRDEKTGFPTWKGKHVSLSSPRDVTESHDVFYRPTGSERAVKYDIRSANGQIVGHTVLEIDQDWPTQLLDIAIQDQHKGKRYAEKAVAGIVADAGEIGIWHIIPSARSWWERVGTQTVDAHNGTLAFNDYADARASRENAGSLGEDVGIRYNVQNAASTAAAKLRVDVPNEAWLQEQIDYAKSKGSNRYGVPYMGKQTARFNGAVRIPVSVLSKLKGQRGEQGNVRADDLAAIKRVMQETGKLPLTERGTEYLPYIEVAHDGSAWISEGNHRIMAAAELGWHDLPVEIRYFDGGERKNGALNPDRLVSGQGDAIRYNITDDGAWEVSEPSKMDDVIYALQDKHIDTKRVMQAIAGAGKKIRDAFNPYLQEELFHGRAAKGVKDFLDFELRPLLKEMQTLGVDMGDFEEYLWNRHAEERNRQIAKVNPDMKDGGSGIKTADARAYLSGLSAEQRQNFEALAAHIDNINAGSRKILVDSGLEKAETIAAWEGAYKHYVPLQREDVDSGYIGTGKGFSVRGSSTKRAMGSGRPVIDIIANLTMQRERNIVRAEKNRVSQAVMGLAVTNPNPDFWTVDKAPKERVVQETTIYSVLDEAGNKVSEFTRMDDADKAAKAIPNSTIEQTWEDRVTERVTPGFLQRDNVLLTRINGQDHYVIFNEREPRAVRMAQAMKNLDADNLGAALSVIGRATRYLASVNTQYNPVFGVINLIRDTQGAMLNLASTPLAGEQKRVLGYTVDALRGIYADIRAHRAGRSPSSNWAQLFEEFQKEGGQTGYRDQYAGAEQRAEAIKSELAQFTEGAPKRLLRGVFVWLSDYNETMENAVRLAAYKAATEKGMSKQQAASLAKNITVNFNRKGQMATQVGALYAFFNASVQGTARIAETLFEKNEGNIKKAKLSKTGKKILAGGIMLGSMQALLLAAAGFDDDEPPEFVRERNLVMPIGDGKYLTLAMPLGFHVLPGIGRIATEFAMSGFKDPAKRTMQFASMLAEAFNPVGNAGFSLQTITPSVVDPFAALAENKDFTGKEIYRENFNAMNPTPGHTRAKDVATVWSRAISEALNFITGGSEFKPGVMSWSPDAIDYLIGQATGGVGREVSKAYQTGAAATTGEDLPLYKVPLVGRFVGDTEGQSGQSAKFYEAIKQINMHEAEYKGLMKSGRGAEAREYMQDNPETRLIMAGNHAETQVRKLRSMKRDLIEKGAEKEKVREIDARISDAMRRFNDRYAAASV